MNLIRFIRALRATKPVADKATLTLRQRLRGKTSATILAQAEARLRRRLFQGIRPEQAIDAVVAWATSVEHPRWCK